MKFTEKKLPGLYEIDLFHVRDHRGSFTKTFHRDSFVKAGLESNFKESFFSFNKKGVIRGMHFQKPPHQHAKLVYSVSGRILDVILDLRTDSPTFGKYEQIEISDANHKAIYLPEGLAHGFCCLSDAIMIYMTSTVHNPDSDSGVRWDSFGMTWPEANPLMSDRDGNFQSFNQLNSPF